MIKSWYLHVREETMAPARMVSFIEEHAISCEVCRQDPDLKEEIAKITELVLPESKIPKAIRQKSNVEDEEEDEIDSENENDEVDTDEEEPDDSLDEEGEEEEEEDELDLDDELISKDDD